MPDDQQAPAAAPAPAPQPERRSASREIALALDLGWRVAALYALSPTMLKQTVPAGTDMLLNRRSLSPADRLELEVQAIAGIAASLDAPIDDADLKALLALALGAGESDAAATTFREALADRHIAFAKKLWAIEEARGKAYELGNFISDTWNRVMQPRAADDPASELIEIFSPARVERMKLLLDDLQARVDPVAAHTVNSHLDEWSACVRATAVPAGKSLEPIERQTIIWRQMLTGDKEPEAYIGRTRRAEVRDELTRVARPSTFHTGARRAVVAVSGAGLGWASVDNPDEGEGVAARVLALAGALGITRASMTGTVRRGVQGWSELMWNRALAVVICRETSLIEEVFGQQAKR